METVEIGKKKKLFVPFFPFSACGVAFRLAFPFLFFRVQKEKDSGGSSDAAMIRFFGRTGILLTECRI